MSLADELLLVSCSPEEARARVREALLAAGWRPADRRADGMLGFERGSLGAAVALGVLAGKNFHLSVGLGVEADAGEGTWIRYRPGAGEGALLGGILGHRRAAREHARTVAALQAAFARAELLQEPPDRGKTT